MLSKQIGDGISKEAGNFLVDTAGRGQEPGLHALSHATLERWRVPARSLIKEILKVPSSARDNEFWNQ